LVEVELKMAKKIKYPSKRRSPIVHTVSGYRRKNGTYVRPHVRGSGRGRPLPRTKLVRRRVYDDSTEDGPEAWTITFNYKDGKKEAVTVIAPSYEKAMDEAFEERKRQHEKPVGITITDPSLWGAIKGALKAGGRVAKYAGKRARFTVRKHAIMGLLHDAYSKDPIRRKAARIALKREFPEVYAMCDFSRERYVR